MRWPQTSSCVQRGPENQRFPVLRSRNGTSHHCVCRTVGKWLSVQAASKYTPEKYLSIRDKVQEGPWAGFQLACLQTPGVGGVEEEEDTTPLSGSCLWDLHTHPLYL